MYQKLGFQGDFQPKSTQKFRFLSKTPQIFGKLSSKNPKTQFFRNFRNMKSVKSVQKSPVLKTVQVGTRLNKMTVLNAFKHFWFQVQQLLFWGLFKDLFLYSFCAFHVSEISEKLSFWVLGTEFSENLGFFWTKLLIFKGYFV